MDKTDQRGRSSFRGRPLRVAVALCIAVGAYFLVYRPLQINWGATDVEIDRAMPGDGIVDRPVFVATRAMTVAAAPEDVWPWIVQIGHTRAGWYSYDVVDNHISGRVSNPPRHCGDGCVRMPTVSRPRTCKSSSSCRSRPV
jgi:hypothetical protein